MVSAVYMTANHRQVPGQSKIAACQPERRQSANVVTCTPQGKFVSVFFKEVVGLSPSATSSMLAATPLALSVSSLIAQLVSGWIGAYSCCGLQQPWSAATAVMHAMLSPSMACAVDTCSTGVLGCVIGTHQPTESAVTVKWQKVEAARLTGFEFLTAEALLVARRSHQDDCAL